MRDLFQRVGILEMRAVESVKVSDDHEVRLRKQEHLTAKVVGAALMGSTVGAWILSQLGSCVG